VVCEVSCTYGFLVRPCFSSRSASPAGANPDCPGGRANHFVLARARHGFGFPDYDNWSAWAPDVEVPNSIMVADRATDVTEWDRWLLRQTWDRLKSRWR